MIKKWVKRVSISLGILLVNYYILYYFSMFNPHPLDDSKQIQIAEYRSRTLNITDSCVSLKSIGPWDLDVIGLVKPPELQSCSHPEFPNIFQLDLNNTLINIYHDVNLTCCLHPFFRASDKSVLYPQQCYHIKNERTKLPAGLDYFAIECSHNSGRWDLPTDTFKKVQLFPLVDPEKELKAKNVTSEDIKGIRPNVLIFGIDATSYMSFLRVFPQSEKYLREDLGSLIMEGYNRVGDNTLPNLLPILTGKTLNETRATCWPNETAYFDECHFIWEDFSRLGYRTGFAEDAVHLGTFTVDKRRGFKRNPVDHQLHPLSFAKAVAFNYNDKRVPCIGSHLWFEDLTDFAMRVAHSSKISRDPFFHFSWSTSLTHSDNNNGFLGDGALLRMLKFLKEGGHLDNTLLIVMSDHGARYGFLRNSLRGKLEENSPFLYIRPPKWFLRAYPRAIFNLLANQGRLTTHHDLRETLLDILEHVTQGSLPSGGIIVPKYSPEDFPGFPKPSKRKRGVGISLFGEIPLNRTCSEAGIPEEFCPCAISRIEEIPPTQFDSNMSRMASFVVDYINQYVKDEGFEGKCQPLKLESLQRAYRIHKVGGDTGWTLVVVTTPGDAHFEATIYRKNDLDLKDSASLAEWVIKGDIARINRYQGQSDCAPPHLKYYCMCSTLNITDEELIDVIQSV